MDGYGLIMLRSVYFCVEIYVFVVYRSRIEINQKKRQECGQLVLSSKKLRGCGLIIV